MQDRGVLVVRCGWAHTASVARQRRNGRLFAAAVPGQGPRPTAPGATPTRAGRPLQADSVTVTGLSAASAVGACSHTRHLLRAMRGAYRLSGGSLGSAPVAGARACVVAPLERHCSTGSRLRGGVAALSSLLCWVSLPVWCGLLVGRLVAQGRKCALPVDCGRYRSAARPERDCGAHTTQGSKRHRRERSAADRRASASRSGSRHRDSREDPSTRQKPRDSSSRATCQTLGEPFLRAGPPEGHRTRLRACGRMDAERSAVHPHVAGRPRRYPYGHRRRSRRVDGARIGPLLRRDL